MASSLLHKAHINLNSITRAYIYTRHSHPSGHTVTSRYPTKCSQERQTMLPIPEKTPQKSSPKNGSAIYTYSKSSGLFTGDARMGLSTTGLSNHPPLVEILRLFLIKSPVLALPARSCLSGSVLSTGAYSWSTAR